jgi:hypothetical protein
MDVISHLRGLSSAAVDSLYVSPCTVQAITRALPPLARQFILRLVFVDEPVRTRTHFGAFFVPVLASGARKEAAFRAHRWSVQVKKSAIRDWMLSVAQAVEEHARAMECLVALQVRAAGLCPSHATLAASTAGADPPRTDRQWRR